MDITSSRKPSLILSQDTRQSHSLLCFISLHCTAKSLQSCPTLQPHRQQPKRLPRPWDSPGENTGVGCHFLLQCMKVKRESEVTQSFPILSDPMDCSLPGSSVHGIFPGKSTGVGCHCLLLEDSTYAYFTLLFFKKNNFNVSVKTAE